MDLFNGMECIYLFNEMLRKELMLILTGILLIEVVLFQLSNAVESVYISGTIHPFRKGVTRISNIIFILSDCSHCFK